MPRHAAMIISPGLTAGRGLKPAPLCGRNERTAISPGLTAGRGLKPSAHERVIMTRLISPGLTAGRGLKQVAARHGDRGYADFARPHGRARIETENSITYAGLIPISPGLTAGRGLKQAPSHAIAVRTRISPGLTAGRGLKQIIDRSRFPQHQISPGLTAGRGLKRGAGHAADRRCKDFARPHGRARIETAGLVGHGDCS